MFSKYLNTSIGRQIRRVRSNLKMRRLDSKSIPEATYEIRLFMVVRNEDLRLPYFFKYYSSLGVDRFFVVDNGSTDNTVSFLLDQKNTHVFQTKEKHTRHPAWIDALLHRYGIGHWCIAVDADEFMIYPYCEKLSLFDLCAFLEQEGYNALRCILLDMYANKPIRLTSYKKGSNPLLTASYFDLSNNIYNRGSFWAGMRQRIFGLYPNITKFPLFKFNPLMFLADGMHYLKGATSIADLQGASLHFKFFSDFCLRAEEETRRQQHWNKAVEYKAYVKKLNQQPDLNLYYDKSVRYIDSNQLVKLQIMRSSPALDACFENIRLLKKTDIPKLSVIIPTYKRLNTLKECLASFFNQTYPKDKCEIIIVDDGSKDDTEEFIKTIQKDHHNLRYLKQENRGMFPSWNRGASSAEADLVVFIDDDCILPKNFLEKIIESFNKYPDISACVGSEIHLFKNRFFAPLTNYYKSQKNNGWSVIFSELTPEVMLVSNRSALKKDVFLNMGGFDYKSDRDRGPADLDLGFRLLEKGHKICVTNNVFVYHYQRNSPKEIVVRNYIFGVTGPRNFKKHFNHWFMLGLPFGRWICSPSAPFALYLHIDSFKILTCLLVFTFFFAKMGLILLSLYFLRGYIVFRKEGGTLRQFFIYKVYKLLQEGSFFAGHVVGSIKNRIIHI